MAEEKHHRHLFGRHHEEEEEEDKISEGVAFTGGGDGFAGGDYSSENIGGGYSQTIEESADDYEKEKKEHKHKEQLGEIDALADDDFDLYEKEETKKDLEHGHKHNIEEEVPATVGVGPVGCAGHEHHEKKEDNEEE